MDLARPFLGVTPETLRAYCHARALPYAVDPTNSDAGRRRNAVREALANLRPLFPALDRAVARAAEVIAQEERGSPRARLRRSVRERFAADDDLRDLDFAHVEAAVRALESGRSGTYFMKPGIGAESRGRLDCGYHNHEVTAWGPPMPNPFAIGYGLEYQEVYRNLPYLAELREGQTV